MQDPGFTAESPTSSEDVSTVRCAHTNVQLASLTQVGRHKFAQWHRTSVQLLEYRLTKWNQLGWEVSRLTSEFNLQEVGTLPGRLP
jgi:hypothetical protein